MKERKQPVKPTDIKKSIVTSQKTGVPATFTATRKLKNTLGIIIAVFAFALYAQSISYSYTLDDYSVTKDNKIVTQGVTAIPTLLKSYYWYGTETAKVPEYRPVSLIMLATEWQFFPDNPHIYHLINILLYSITCWLLFLLLCKLFEDQSLVYAIIFPFVCALLYTAHPIHTEVVDSIKSRDEIVCFLFAILSVYLFVKSIQNKSIINIVLASICYFLSLLSKETGIAYLVLIPLILFVFTKATKRNIVITMLALIISTGACFLIRSIVLASIPANSFETLLHNSLVAAPDFISQKATAFYILLKYILLLLFPYSLSYDYAYSQIPTQTITDLPALAGIVIYFVIGIYALINIRKKSIMAFAILFYLITLVPVSNIFILVGAQMAERFVYMPSLGFCMIVSIFLIRLTKADVSKKQFVSVKQYISGNPAVFIIAFILTGLYSARTFARNPDWKNDVALFGHDVKVVDNSALAHYRWGRMLALVLYPQEKDKVKQNEILDEAITELNKTVTIFRNYSFPVAHAILGSCYSKKDDYADAINNYEIAIKWDKKPRLEVFSDLAMMYGKTMQFDKALSILDSSLKYDPDNAEMYNNRGNALAGLGRYEEAIPEFKKAVGLNVSFEAALKNLGHIYILVKQYPNAIEYLNKAIALDSTDAESIRFISVAYQNEGDKASAEKYINKLNQLNASPQK